MQLEGQYTFRAPVQAVWGALMDPAVLAQALPGGEQLKQVGENEYQAVMNVRVGPVQGRFEGRIELLDIEPFRSYRMKVAGQGAPGFVNGEGTLLLESAQAEDGGEVALLNYRGDVQIGGKIAGVSQRLVESSAKSLTRQGLQALERQIAAQLAPPPVAAAAQFGSAVGDFEPMVAPVVAETAAPSSAPAPASVVTNGGGEAAAGWQPVPTRRTVLTSAAPAGGMSATSVMLTTAKDVASDLASDYIPPAQQEKVFWAAVGALGMLLFVVLVRLVQKR